MMVKYDGIKGGQVWDINSLHRYGGVILPYGKTRMIGEEVKLSGQTLSYFTAIHDSIWRGVWWEEIPLFRM